MEKTSEGGGRKRDAEWEGSRRRVEEEGGIGETRDGREKGIDNQLMLRADEKGDGSREERLTLDGHQEGLVQVSLGSIQPSVTRLHQRLDLVLSDLLVPPLERSKPRAKDDRGSLAVVVVLGEKVPHLHLDELEHLRVVDLVDLVNEDNELLDTDLTGEEEVLSSLGHLTVSGSDDDDGGVELGGSGDHVLDVWRE
jgi:hypothetical protein